MADLFRESIVGDFAAVMDNLETIQITLLRSTPEVVTVVGANRSQMSRSVAQAGGVNYEADDISFGFECAAFVPVKNVADIRKQDLLTDSDGNVFIVQSAQLAVLQTVWNLTCRAKRNG